MKSDYDESGEINKKQIMKGLKCHAKDSAFYRLTGVILNNAIVKFAFKRSLPED